MRPTLLRTPLPVLALAGLLLTGCTRDGSDANAGVTSPPLPTGATMSSVPTACGGPTLGVSVMPQGGLVGVPFPTQPRVEFRSAQGALLPVSSRVTASLVGTSIALGGTTSVASDRGVATFRDLRVSEPGTYTLQFDAPGATPVSAAIVVDAPCSFSVELQPMLPGQEASGTTIHVGPASGFFMAAVETGPACEWEPYATETFLGIDRPGVRTGSGPMMIAVGTLPSIAPARTGTIQLGTGPGAGGTKFFTVTQSH